VSFESPSSYRQGLTASHTTAAIDVVKTRIQIDPAFKGLSILSGTRLVISKERPSALLTGFGPTALGYFVQVRSGLVSPSPPLIA
jgi:hypothetical protein